MKEQATVPGVRREIVRILARAASAHERGDLSRIDNEFDRLEALVRSLGQSAPAEFELTVEFTSGWEDARNHDWQFYEPIGPDDWPRLARDLASNLEREQPITDQAIINQFGRKQTGPSGCVGMLLGLRA